MPVLMPAIFKILVRNCIVNLYVVVLKVIAPRVVRNFSTGDKNQVERYCKKMNAGEAYALLAAVITQRPWDDIISYDMSRYSSNIPLQHMYL